MKLNPPTYTRLAHTFPATDLKFIHDMLLMRHASGDYRKDGRYKDSEGSVEIATGILYESDSLMLANEVAAAYKAKLDGLPAAERERYFSPATMRAYMKNLLCSVHLDDLLVEFETPTTHVMRPYRMYNYTLLYLHPEKGLEQKREWLKRNSVTI